MKKPDLLAVAHYLIGYLSYSQVPALAKRHKVEAKKDSATARQSRLTPPFSFAYFRAATFSLSARPISSTIIWSSMVLGSAFFKTRAASLIRPTIRSMVS